MALIPRIYVRGTAGPDYPPDARDLADVRIAGLALPRRASVAVLATTALLLVDQLRLVLPPNPSSLGALHPLELERFALFLVVPLAVVLLGFRDRPARYGLRLGDWRWGLGLLLAGLAVMTPIILGLSGLEAFRAYYGGRTEPLAERLLNHLAELIPAEFLLRGFLMFALWRRIGPLALVVVQVPFVGGVVFAWLDWRTGSILWSALGHVYVLTLMVVAVGGATL